MPRKRLARRGRVGEATSGIPPQATLSVTPATLPFTATTGAAAFEGEEPFRVTNTGAGNFAGVVVSEDASWLTLRHEIEPVTGELLLYPQISPAALSAGSYTGTLTVTDANASNSLVNVTATLVVSAATVIMSVTPSQPTTTVVDEQAGTPFTLSVEGFGGALATPTVGTITYSGAFTNWVSSTNVTADGDGTFTVTVTPTGVGGTVGGPYTATIPIISAGAANSPVNVTAELTVTSSQQALITLSRSLDDMRATEGGSNPSATTVAVSPADANFPLAGPVISSTSYTGAFTGWATPALSAGTSLTVTPNITGLSAGSGYVHVDITDANATNTARYSAILLIDQATPTPQLSVSPSSIAFSSAVGTNPADQTIAVTNATGSLPNLGTVSVAFVTQPTWATVSYAGGTITVVYDTAALSAATYTATIRVTATLAANSPVDIPLTMTKNAVFVGSYPPAPQLASLANGWSYDATVGHPKGSCFNDGGFAGAANGAMPTFSGTVHSVTNQTTLNTALANLANGTIVDGDVIEITAGLSFANVQWPARPGWVEGVSGFVQVRTANHVSLPTYQSTAGPNKFTAANRANPTSHAAHVFTITNGGANNRSVLLLQQQARGYWFTGMELANTSTVNTYLLHTGAHSGTTLANGLVANLPSHIVFDRCIVRDPGVNQPTGRIVGGGSRYTVWRQCWFPSIFKDNTEQQVFNFINGCERWDVIGCRGGGFGEHVLFGGGDPSIADWVPRDFMFLWNFWYNDVRNALDSLGVPSDDNKNAFELKTGGRVGFWFNRVDGLNYNGQQKYGLLVKAVDQHSSGLTNPVEYAAHAHDVIFWGNELVRNVNKGFFHVMDEDWETGVTPPPSRIVGTERVECAWNVHSFDLSIPARINNAVGTPGKADVQAMNTSKSKGDGIPGVWCYHNSFDSRHSFMAPASAAGASHQWSNIKYFNNVGHSACFYDMIAHGSGGGTQDTALNTTYGVGTWDFRRNMVLAGTQGWNATLGGGNNRNFMSHTSTRNSVFVNPVASNGDFTLVTNSAPTDYYLGDAYGGGYQVNVGYSKAYLDEMLNGVEDN